MFALDWHAHQSSDWVPSRLAAALVAGTNRVAGQVVQPDLFCAQLLPHNDPRRARSWTPTEIDGLLVLFNGHISNARELAAELGLNWPSRPDTPDLARLYGRLLRQSGAGCDLRIIGEYAAAVVDQTRQTLRLVRSPLRAHELAEAQAPRQLAEVYAAALS